MHKSVYIYIRKRDNVTRAKRWQGCRLVLKDRRRRPSDAVNLFCRISWGSRAKERMRMVCYHNPVSQLTCRLFMFAACTNGTPANPNTSTSISRLDPIRRERLAGRCRRHRVSFSLSSSFFLLCSEFLDDARVASNEANSMGACLLACLPACLPLGITACTCTRGWSRAFFFVGSRASCKEPLRSTPSRNYGFSYLPPVTHFVNTSLTYKVVVLVVRCFAALCRLGVCVRAPLSAVLVIRLSRSPCFDIRRSFFILRPVPHLYLKIIVYQSNKNTKN